MKLTSDYDIWWSYIPHFMRSPFYVYAYSFGELLSLSLYAQYQERGQAMVEQYLDLLCAGGSKSPQELLQPLSIDLHQRAFWEAGMTSIKKLVDEAKQIFKQV